MRQGLRNRKTRRERHVTTALSDEEWALIDEMANYEDKFTATWARDVLVSTALRLRAQRFLTD